MRVFGRSRIHGFVLRFLRTILSQEWVGTRWIETVHLDFAFKERRVCIGVFGTDRKHLPNCSLPQLLFE
jgi:hypothetical protein